MIDENIIQNWLLEEGALREKKDDENADFHFIIETPKDNIMDVVKPKGKDCIVIGCATQVSPEHGNLMVSADAKKQKDFILDLNMGLNQFLVDFELQINQNILQQFIVTDITFEDAMTKDNLFKSIKRVFKAKLHCIWLIEKTFGSPADQSLQSNENSMFV